MKQVILISGRLCSGKTGLAALLCEEFGYHLVRTSELVKQKAAQAGIGEDRATLQRLGDQLDRETGHKWVLQAVEDRASMLDHDATIVVDSVRNAKQLSCFRSIPGLRALHVHLYASEDVLRARFAAKTGQRLGTARSKYIGADPIKTDRDIESFRDDADVRIYTTRTDARDNLVRVAARLGLYPGPNVRCVDVLVGGQYGSEGKGHIAAYLAREYGVLVRVGGPNAGHTVSSASGIYTYHHLPSGSRDVAAKLLLGPGMTINVATLLDEIRECGIGPDRLFIDPQAMIIEPKDVRREAGLVKTIASTGRGGGAAAARRILGRQPGVVRLAKDVAQLRPFVGTAPTYRGGTLGQLEAAYRSRVPILLEGTQGSLLSIYHGYYPHVTSRDTNVAGCLAEAGISPSRVRRVLMVVRYTPIRVGDPKGRGMTSGRLKHEVSWDEVARHAGLDVGKLRRHEKTSTTKRKRKVGWFEWEQFRIACALNAPTDIVLTFADYLSVANRKARRFEQLTQDTIKFVEELERVAQAPVSLINARFPREPHEVMDLRSVIDRRNWSGDVEA